MPYLSKSEAVFYEGIKGKRQEAVLRRIYELHCEKLKRRSLPKSDIFDMYRDFFK